MAEEKVMIVDDDKEFLSELRETLLLSGYTPIAIDNGDIVLNVARMIKPDVILLDLKMEKNGFEVAEELRKNPVTAGIPTIAITGYYSKQDLPLISEIYGIKRFLLKPFNPLDVIVKLEEALKERY